MGFFALINNSISVCTYNVRQFLSRLSYRIIIFFFFFKKFRLTQSPRAIVINIRCALYTRASLSVKYILESRGNFSIRLKEEGWFELYMFFLWTIEYIVCRLQSKRRFLSPNLTCVYSDSESFHISKLLFLMCYLR